MKMTRIVPLENGDYLFERVDPPPSRYCEGDIVRAVHPKYHPLNITVGKVVRVYKEHSFPSTGRYFATSDISFSHYTYRIENEEGTVLTHPNGIKFTEDMMAEASQDEKTAFLGTTHGIL